MTTPARAPLVAVKLHPVGRARTVAVDPAVDPVPGAAEQVVIETESGAALGTVVRAPSALNERRRPAEGTPERVIRRATHEDIVTRLQHQERERQAWQLAGLKIREHGLAMKLTRVEQTFDGKLVFFFTADGRIDFRDLVKDLAAELRVRIEMRQIGVRDEAKIIGGYGTCGRPLCCTTFLTSFEPVSIKMAKQQDLSLNPSKLSGLCGRLKCCLRYELPNAKGIVHGGCGSEGGCDNPTGCGCHADRSERASQCTRCGGGRSA